MEYKIDKEYDDVRLDRYLRKNFPDLTLTEIFKGIRVGKIKVNGKKSKENYRLQNGDIIKVFFSSEKKDQTEDIMKISSEQKKWIKEKIVYEDENILIFNKDENLVMHKGSGHDYGMSELIKGYLNNPNFNFVNRIDKATSGLVIGAKNLVVARELSEEIRNRKIEKKYYILVRGVVPKDNFIVKTWLKKIEDRVIELDKPESDARESISRFRVIKRGDNVTLLEGILGTGRTHQLRVQLSSKGHPIIGDSKYGNDKVRSMFLFSYYVRIEKYGIEVELPLPDKYKSYL